MSKSFKTTSKLFSWLPNMTLIGICLIQWFLMPAWGLMLVLDKLVLFYWLIHRPDRISLAWLSLFYLVADIMNGLPLGCSALIMLVCAWIILLQRHVIMQQTFLLQWLFTALIIVIYLDAIAVINFLYYSVQIPFLYIALSGLMSFFLYPPIAYCLYKIQKMLPLAASPEVQNV